MGEQARDGSVRVYVKLHGRRHVVHAHGKDVARSILTDVFGRSYAEGDALRYREFRETFLTPRLDEEEWSVSEEDVRAWASRYDTYQAILEQSRARQATTGPGRTGGGSGHQDSSDPPGPSTASNVVRITWDRGGLTTAKLLYRTAQVVLLDGEMPSGGRPPAIGTLVRLTLPGERGTRGGRIAAYGQSSVYLIALGSRAIRGSRRVRVDLPARGKSAVLRGRILAMHIVDLSRGGARVRGPRLPVGTEVLLTFTPPGTAVAKTMRCVVVRSTGDEAEGEMGVAFCMASLHLPSTVLAQRGART